MPRTGAERDGTEKAPAASTDCPIIEFRRASVARGARARGHCRAFGERDEGPTAVVRDAPDGKRQRRHFP